MQSILPYDCIADILKFLRDDKKTLYECLFVDRNFCQLTIPLLWSRPFEKENMKKSYIIINTLVACLKEKEKQQLMKEFNDSIEIKIALFDYASYIKGFDYQNFEYAIKKWTESYFNYFVQPFNIHIFIFQLMGDLIFTRTKNFKMLNLSHDKYHDEEEKSFEYNIFQKILTFNNIKKVLINLEKLELKYFSWGHDIDGSLGDKISNFFIELSKYSNNIQDLIIDIFFDSTNTSKVSKSLAKLIESQKNLNSLQVTEYIDYSFINSIQSQANSLKFLRIIELSNFHSLLPILYHCVKLKTLELTEYFEVEDLCELYNSHISLPPIHIENLLAYQIEMERNIQNFEDAMAILINLSKHKLKSLTMEFVTCRTISFLKLSCPINLTYLSLKISTFGLIKLYEIISLLKLLKTLIIIESGRYEDPLSPESSNKINQLIKLAFSIPISLTRLGISFLVDLTGYEMFYKEFSVPIQELDIYISLDDDHLKGIISYAEKNRNLKRVGIMRFNHSCLDGHISNDLYLKAKSLIPIIGETKKIKHFVNR